MVAYTEEMGFGEDFLLNYGLLCACVCADIPVGDDQRCGGDPSWYCQQGTHHLWEYAGPL